METPVYCFRVDGQKWRFSNTMVPCIIQRTPCVRACVYSIVFPLFKRFRLGRRKLFEYATSSRFYCFRKKNLRFKKFQDLCGQGLRIFC